MSEKVDVIVVGAGLAGLGAAYHLAAAGADVLVVERGDYPGSKNVTGGRLYLNPVRPYYPDLFSGEKLSQVPFELPVVKERLTMMGSTASTSLEFQSDGYLESPPHSVTLLRGVFDRWLGEAAAGRGAMIVAGYRVDDLLWEGERVVGIVSAGDKVLADVVVAADGALSFIAERAGLRPRHNPKHFALGIKEVIELPAPTIADRFGLRPGQGAAQLYFGVLTEGMTGGGFLYTNRESISLGLVLGMQAMLEKGAAFQSHELLDAFKSRPEIAALLAGGRVLEYSAHAIPEDATRAMPRLVRHGLLVAGDAAGMGLNMGITVRGMDLALAAGAMAARAILEARADGDFSAYSLGRYEEALRRSFVLQDLNTFRAIQDFLANPRLYSLYPEAVAAMMERLFWIGEGPKQRLGKTILASTRQIPLAAMLRDLWALRRA
jgi:electron transfer flavoprotein-quinone oxidoreductase